MTWLTGVLGVWAAIGPIIGILLGHYLTHSGQHEQWLRDCRKQEFRELLTAFSKCYVTVMLFGRPGVIRNEQEMKDYFDDQREALVTVSDRMYIAEDVGKLDLYRRWTAAVGDFNRDNAHEVFSTRFDEIRLEILRVAHRGL